MKVRVDLDIKFEISNVFKEDWLTCVEFEKKDKKYITKQPIETSFTSKEYGWFFVNGKNGEISVTDVKVKFKGITNIDSTNIKIMRFFYNQQKEVYSTFDDITDFEIIDVRLNKDKHKTPFNQTELYDNKEFIDYVKKEFLGNIIFTPNIDIEMR